MTTQPSRTRSMIGGIAMLVVMLVGLVVMTGLGRFPFGRGPVGWFLVVWVVIGLVGAGLSFFNAAIRGRIALPRDAAVDIRDGDPEAHPD